jgi:hypothetical protein
MLSLFLEKTSEYLTIFHPQTALNTLKKSDFKYRLGENRILRSNFAIQENYTELIVFNNNSLTVESSGLLLVQSAQCRFL